MTGMMLGSVGETKEGRKVRNAVPWGVSKSRHSAGLLSVTYTDEHISSQHSPLKSRRRSTERFIHLPRSHR